MKNDLSSIKTQLSPRRLVDRLLEWLHNPSFKETVSFLRMLVRYLLFPIVFIWIFVNFLTPSVNLIMEGTRAEFAGLFIAVSSGMVVGYFFYGVLRLIRANRAGEYLIAQKNDSLPYTELPSAQIVGLSLSRTSPYMKHPSWKELSEKYGHDFAVRVLVTAGSDMSHVELTAHAEALTPLPQECGTLTPDYICALHEAAHSIVAAAQGLIPTEVALSPHAQRGTGGHAHYTFPHPRHTEEDELWAQTITSLAGRVGLKDQGGSSDIVSALGFLHRLISLERTPSAYNGPLTPDALFSAADAQAHRLVTNNQASITTLAEDLLKHRIMYAEDIKPHLAELQQ